MISCYASIPFCRKTIVAVEVIKHRGAEDRRIMNWWNKALTLLNPHIKDKSSKDSSLMLTCADQIVL